MRTATPVVSMKDITSMMNKNTIFILLFAAGVIVGYGINQILTNAGQVPESNIEFANQNQGDKETKPQPTRDLPQLEADLYERELPQTSPLWAQIRMNPIQQHGEKIAELLEKEALNEIWIEFIASFPQSASPVIQHLFAASEELRLFLSPGEGGNGRAWMLCSKPKANQEESQPTLNETIAAAFPDAATSELDAGPLQLKVFDTPLGDVAISQGSNIRWLCTSAKAIQALFQQPPPPQKPEQENDETHPLLKRFPDAAISIFLNASQAGPIPFFENVLPLLSQLGSKQAALFYGWPKGQGKLTVLAPAQNLPEWSKEWPPLDHYVFTPSDPVGLIEGAMRWPGKTNSTNPEQEKLNNGPQRTDRSANQANDPAMKQKNNGAGALNQIQAMRQQLLSKLVPKGNTIGINFFGFSYGVPAMVMALPELASQDVLLNALAQKKNKINEEKIEIANLPGKFYQLPQSNPKGLHELLMIERDAVTYIFDQKMLAQHYLGELSDPSVVKSERPMKWRDRLEDVRSPAQIKLLATPEFFEYVMNQEKQQWKNNQEILQQYDRLIEELQPVFQPLAISAGLDNAEWFIEIQAEETNGHIIGTTLLGLGLSRFLEH